MSAGTEVANSDQGSTKATPTPSPLKSQSGLSSGHLRSGDLKSGELKSGELKSGELKSGELKSSDLKPGELKSSELKSGDLKDTAAAASKPSAASVTMVVEPTAKPEPTDSAVAVQLDGAKATANAQPNNLAAQAAAQPETSQQAQPSQPGLSAPSQQPPQQLKAPAQQGPATRNKPTSASRAPQQASAQQSQPQQQQGAASRGVNQGPKQQQQQPASQARPAAASAPDGPKPAAPAWGGQKPLQWNKIAAAQSDKVCEASLPPQTNHTRVTNARMLLVLATPVFKDLCLALLPVSFYSTTDVCVVSKRPCPLSILFTHNY